MLFSDCRYLPRPHTFPFDGLGSLSTSGGQTERLPEMRSAREHSPCLCMFRGVGYVLAVLRVGEGVFGLIVYVCLQSPGSWGLGFGRSLAWCSGAGVLPGGDWCDGWPGGFCAGEVEGGRHYAVERPGARRRGSPEAGLSSLCMRRAPVLSRGSGFCHVLA